MNEESSVNPSVVPEESDIDVVTLLKRLQQQILSLETKIDLLIGQSKEKLSGEKSSLDRPFRKRPFSHRSFDQPQRHGRGEYGRTPGERDSARGHIYEHRPSQYEHNPSKESRNASPGKKPFSSKRKDRE
jgi:hypothetical protein